MTKDYLKKIFNQKFELVKKITLENVKNIKNENSYFLDAGGGKKSVIEFEDYKKIVIDISDVQLSLNKENAIFFKADLEKYIEINKYDIILCYDVIEHIKNPKLAINNMLKSLVKGGVLIIGAPNPKSFWGLVTKFTPYSIHRIYYKYILGSKNANPKTGPFKTYLSFKITPERIKKEYNNDKFKIIFYDVFEGYLQKLTESKFYILKILLKILRIINFNLILSNYIIVIKKII